MKALLHPVRLARIIALLLVGLSASQAPAQSPAPSVATGEDWTFPAGANVKPLDFSGLFRGSESALNPPQSPVVGEGILKHLQLHYNWVDFNNAEGTYTFTGTTSDGRKRLADALDEAWDPVAQKPRYLLIIRLEVSQYGGWGGKNIPTWVTNKYNIGSGTPSHTFQTREAAGGNPEIRYAAPWHPGVQTEFQKLIQELCKSTRTVNGFQYIAHPSLATIFLHGCSGSRGEESSVNTDGWTNTGFDEAAASAIALGFKDNSGGTSNKGQVIGNAITPTWQARVGYWKNALTANGNAALIRKITSVGGGQWGGTSYDGDAFQDYVISQGMGLRHGFIEQYFYGHAMPPKGGQRYVAAAAGGGGHVVSDWSHALRDGRFWADENEGNHWLSRETGTSGQNLSQNINQPDGVPGPVRDLAYRTPFFRAAQLGMNFLWAGPWQVRYASYDNPSESSATVSVQQLDEDFVDGRASIAKWYANVAGKGPATSPDAAVWLRQATVNNVPGAPDPATWKNFERLLMHRDLTSSGGIGAVTTAADLKKMPNVHNKSGDEHMARRTDHASGNRRMAFKLHSDFKASLAYPVQIKVTYQDTSSALHNKWNVRVVKSGNTTVSLGNVAMTGNGQWKTATFTVESANAFIASPTALGTDSAAPSSDPDDPAGIDFVVEVPSPTTADLTVRYVRVVRLSPPGGGGGGGGAGTHETNDLSIAMSSGDSWTSVTSDPEASDGSFVRFDANAVNDFITFDIPSVPAGTYDVAVKFNNNNTRGIYQLAIDDGSGFASHGSAQDLYTASFTWSTISFGAKTLATTGTKRFRFTATGKNASSTGYKLGIDTITLTPVTVAPNASVTGNSVTIFNGDSTPQTADNTDFGATDVATGTITQDFSILNTGTATLTVSGAIATGDFGILTAPGGSVAPGASTNFTVAFNPTAAGLRTGTVSFDTNDAINDPYVFSVQGTGTAFAAIANDANSLVIAATSSGDATATVSDSLANNGNFVRFDGNAVNDFITFDVPVPASDTYQVTAKFNDNTTRGIYQLAIDNGAGFVDLGTPKDLYSEVFTFSTHDFGTVALTNGTRKFRFTAIGQNTEATGFKIGVDLIWLTPINGAAEINVTGNGATIVDGDSTPATGDHTDFGSADVSGATVTRTFTIQNTGTVALSVGSVSLSGAHAGDFSVTAQPASSVAAGGSTTFQVQFDPSVAGTRTASVSFTNGDADESPYSFSLQGTGNAPAISYVAKSDQGSGGATVTSLNIAKPSGVQSGDVLLAAIVTGQDDVGTITSSGWTAVRTLNDGLKLTLFRKTAGSSEPANYTWSWSTARKAVGAIVAFRGVNGTTPIQVENGATTSTTTATHTTPTIATTGTATWLVSIFADVKTTASTWTASGATERVDANAGGSSAVPSLALYTEGPVSAGSHSQTATASQTNLSAVKEIVALQP